MLERSKWATGRLWRRNSPLVRRAAGGYRTDAKSSSRGWSWAGEGGGVGRVIRLGWLLAGAVVLLALFPATAAATVNGGCTATGTSTSGGVIDLTTNAVWHVRSTDSISLAGQATVPQTSATVGAYAFGFVVPIGGGTADPSLAAESDSFEIAALAFLGRTFLISGASDG